MNYLNNKLIENLYVQKKSLYAETYSLIYKTILNRTK